LLINLRVLNLGHNQLKEIDIKLFSFYRLEELYLGNNQLEHLRWNFHKFKRLKKLHIDCNNINYIPNSVARLNSLVEFSVVPNPLSNINDDDVVWACHSGYINIILEYLDKQPIPPNYPYANDIIKLDEKKERKIKIVYRRSVTSSKTPQNS